MLESGAVDERFGLLWCALWLSSCGGEVADSTANSSGGPSGGATAGGHAAGGTWGTGGVVAMDAAETGGSADAGLDSPAEDARLPECPADVPWNTPCSDEGFACVSNYTKTSHLPNCTDHGRCLNGIWARTRTCRDDARCPNETPTLGSPCGDVGLTCGYTEQRDTCLWCDGGCPDVILECRGQTDYCCDVAGCGGSLYCDAEGRWQPDRDGGIGYGCTT